MPLKILDVGMSFGLAVGPVFQGTDCQVVYLPKWGDALSQLDGVGLVGFGGGADIHPSLYHSNNVASMVGNATSARDELEQLLFAECVKRKIPMFGICRGAQLVCALSGGKLVQDVEGHGGMHTLTLDDGSMLPMTSAHHQMMYPWEIPHKLIGWTKPKSREYVHDIPNYQQPTCDPEVVYFPTTNSLAVQGHPEWMDPRCKTVVKVREWVSEYLNVSL